MMDLDALNELVLKKYIAVKKHPEEDLYLYNYTQKTQYEGHWNEITLQCRGLIMNNEGDIKSRPFPKFFNYEEVKHKIPVDESYQVLEKMDGSLGILYWAGDTPCIATRGSFESDQAIRATAMLQSRYRHAIQHLRRDVTYLFEIIYPTNRIVVDYGELDELILLGMMETTTGKDLPLEAIGFPLVNDCGMNTPIDRLKAMNLENKEGFVIKYQSGYRIKVKFEEYCRLHAIVTQVSSYSIWENMLLNQPLDILLENVPDEFYEWVKETESRLKKEYESVLVKCQADYKELENRKETALYFRQCEHPDVLFALLDKKDVFSIIMKKIKPEYDRPFVNSKE